MKKRIKSPTRQVEMDCITPSDLEKSPKALLMFSLKDLASNEYGQPTLAASSLVVVRSAIGLIHENKSSPLALRTMDFDLYVVGLYDPATGTISPRKGHVGNLADLIKVFTWSDLSDVIDHIEELYKNLPQKSTS